MNYIFCNLLYELTIKEDKESFVSKLKVLLKKRNSGSTHYLTTIETIGNFQRIHSYL